MFDRFLGGQRASSGGNLVFGEVEAGWLTERYGTPLYVIDAGDFRSKIRDFVSAARGAHGDCRVSYSIKANSALAVLGIASGEGLFADTASEGELEAALRASFSPQRIQLHGNNKSDGELERAVLLDIGRVVLDHFSEIERLAGIAQRHGRSPRVMIRLAPGVDPDTHVAVRTGQEDSKFGFNISDGSAERAVRAVSRHDALRLVGFHCHVGSQLMNADAHVAAARRLADFAISMRGVAGEVEELNAGGGLGVKYLGEDRPESYESFCGRITEAIRTPFETSGLQVPRIGYEPGRALIAEAGTTLYRAGVIKRVPIDTEGGTRDYLCVDGGMADNPRPQIYGAPYTAMNADRLNANHDTPFRIAGRHCEPDTLIPQALLPASTAEGDLIAIQCTGAYHYDMSSNYNRYPRPAMVIVGDGEPYLAVQREAVDDLFRLERTPGLVKNG
ncbi:MAG: diaminopimelate decarboxylase [Armatimonadetes bacterium]|nr:diaminopimelate decarboxylase [Armatimonadota bacterium]